MLRFAHIAHNALIAALVAAPALTLLATGSVAEIIRTDTGSTASRTTIVPQVLAKLAARAGLQLQLNTDQTLTKSAVKLGGGRIEMSVVPPPAFAMMKRGAGPYAAQPDQAKKLAGNLRLLFGFVGGHFHPIVWADSGITSYADFKGKRVFIGPPAGAANKTLSGLIAVGAGLKPGTDYEPVKIGWGAANQAFQDGQVDVFMRPAVVGSASIQQLALQRPIRIISLTEEDLASQAWADYLERTGTFAGTIPAGTYENQVNDDEDVATVAYGMQLAVNESMDNETAYKLTKAFWDNLDEAKATAALLKSMALDQAFLGANMPLHPGAARYFEEKGVEIPKNLMPPSS